MLPIRKKDKQKPNQTKPKHSSADTAQPSIHTTWVIKKEKMSLTLLQLGGLGSRDLLNKPGF